MKKKSLVIIALFSLSLVTYAQDTKKKDNKEAQKNKELIDIENDKQIVYDNFNRWSIEVNAGQAKGIRPYSRGYSSSNPERVFGNFQFNTFNLGVRYMIGPKFGVRFDAAYDNINDNNNPKSLPFELEQYRFGFQGVVNAIRLFNVEKEAGRFGLLLHGGIQLSLMTSRTPNTPTQFNSFGRTEQNGGLIVGISPQFRITKNFALTGDISTINNYRQHFNWNGSPSDRENNLAGQMVTMTLGLSYSFGSQKIHGDWAIIEDKNAKELKALEGKIDDIETKLIDTDQDGVADYYDVEKNSINGVPVDTKGRMVDQNKNNIPDTLETYITENNNMMLGKIDEKIENNSTIKEGAIIELINQGYVAAYFDVNKTTPTPASSDNVGFILNYLKTNPSATVAIVGAADETGNSKANLKLSKARAEAVKSILINAGISASRISTSAVGEDNSVNPKSEYAKRLVRKVVFKVTK